MVQKGTKPNATTCDNLLNAYAAKGALDYMLGLRTLMKANEITLNHHVFSIFICACEKYEMDETMLMFAKMRQQ